MPPRRSVLFLLLVWLILSAKPRTREESFAGIRITDRKGHGKAVNPFLCVLGG